jgi:hypothetical protein
MGKESNRKASPMRTAVHPRHTPAGTRRVNPAMGFTEWGLIVVLSVLWGGSFFSWGSRYGR